MPLYRALPVFTLGCLLSLALPVLPPVWVLPFLAFALAALLTPGLPWSRSGRWATLKWLAGLLVLLLLGLGFGVWQGHRLMQQLWPMVLDDQPLRGIACLDDFPQARQRGEQRYLRLSLQVQSLQGPNIPENALRGQRIRVSAAWQDGIRAGQCYDIAGSLRRPRDLSSPGVQPFQAMQIANGIRATGRLSRLQERSGETLTGIDGLLLRWRAAWADQIGAMFPDPLQQRLARALVIGDGTQLQADDWQLLQATGTTHLFVVSGLQVSLAASAGFALGWAFGMLLGLCRWPVSPWPMALWASLITAWLYCGLAGAEVPSLRSALMTSSVVLCLLIGRFRAVLAGLVMVACLIVIWQPWTVFLPGFWLSFAAVFFLWLSLMLVYRRRSFLRGLMVAQCAIGVGLAPILLALGKPMATGGWLMNLLAVPFISVLTVWFLLALPLSWLWPALLQTPLTWSGEALLFFWQGMAWWQQLGFTEVLWLPQPQHGLVLLLSLVAVVLLLLPLPWRWRVMAPLLFLPWLFPRLQAAPENGLLVHVLDVGQGQAVVIQTRKHTLLYDTGPASPEGWNSAETVMAPFLARRGIRRPDRLMVSHGDNDHAGGLPWLQARFPAMPVWQAEPQAGQQACQAGQHWHWDGVDFRVLHPLAETLPQKRNNQSCVLRISLPGFTALLPGDIERSAEYALVQKMPEQLKADWLLAPHHGSRSSSSWPFAKAVDPKQVVVSAGYRNAFRHPHAEVVERWQSLGADIHRTDGCGTYTLRVKVGGETRWQCHRQGYRPYWQ